MPTNAEASSSRLPRPLSSTRLRSHEGSKRRKSPPSAIAIEATPRSAGSIGGAAGSGSRRVRTVPPSAAFEPPTPPSPPHEPVLDLVSHVQSPTEATTSTGRQRRKQLRIKYDSSESSVDSSDADDEDPPWWTFTQRGMAKMRARNMRKSGVESESGPNGINGIIGMGGLSGVESGKESGKEASSTRRGSRQSSKDKSRDTPTSSLRNLKRAGPEDKRLSAASVVRPGGSNNSSHHSLLWRRSAGRELPLPNIVLQSSPMARSSSAPTSPIGPDGLASPGLPLFIPNGEQRSGRDSSPLNESPTQLPSRRPLPPARRQLTAPSFPRFLKKTDSGEIHTDTETHNVPSPRLAGKERNRNPEANTPSGILVDGDASLPARPKNRRRPTNRLKINFPDPMKHHFANGWPHAGTWQDAYYGYYNDNPDANATVNPINGSGGHVSENDANANGHANGNGNGVSSRRSSQATTGLSSRRPSRIRDRFITPDQSELSAPPTPPSNSEKRSQRKKTRRARRYRQALAPPTPSGLGFTPNGARANSSDRTEKWKEGKVGASQEGFDWGNRGGSNGRPRAIEEGNELSRQATMNTMTEKLSPTKIAKKSGWPFSRGGQRKDERRVEAVGWRKKARRMLFLDARVTIWIRVMNLAVVVVSLAMAIRIRFDLDKLQLPGLLGSSTTLIIAYSSLTALHVLTAIYREYFGKPIGLWGLRSKMLWVCLDLIFIALWSSAMSIAVNDFIATALQCTADTPWWRGSLAESYAELLQAMGLQSTSSAGEAVTPVEMITHSLGIVLPTEITASKLAREICEKQAGSIALSLITLLLYTINMVLSLFRIFETVRRTANVNRAVMV